MSKTIPTKTNEVKDNVIDLDLGFTSKKKFRINGDDSRMLELNVSDMNILARLNEVYPKLQEEQQLAAKLMEGVELPEDAESEASANAMSVIASRLKEIDSHMREHIDYLFDANVSEITAPDGSMYDPYNGRFRYDYIITVLLTQYEDNIGAEFTKMSKQMEKHTKKYTKGK